MMQQSDVLIAVIGVTGAGKTTFVSKAAARTDMRISSSLSSCTQVIQTARLQIDNKWVTLIDTPGFDDTDRTDADILKLIADYLAETYQNDMLLTGVIMLQPINANRVQGSERRRTRLFEKVCGPGAYGNIVIATTMWSDLESEAIGMERMKERVREVSFWGAMVDKGAQVVKHDNTPRSARNIIQMLINKRAVPLQMQQELVQNGGMIGQTSAGKQLDQDLGEVSARFQRDIEELKRERVQNAEEMRELREQLERARREREELRKSKASFSNVLPAWLSTLMTAGGVAITAAACVIL